MNDKQTDNKDEQTKQNEPQNTQGTNQTKEDIKELEVISSGQVDIRSLLNLSINENDILTTEEAKEFLYNSNKFKELTSETFNEYQLKHITNYIKVNYLIREGKSITEACKVLGIRKQYFFDVVSLNTETTNYYTQSLTIRTHILSDKALEYAEDSSGDMYENERGYLLPNGVNVQRSRLKVDALQWYIGKVNKTTYGNSTTIAGDADNPLKVVAVTGMVIE